MNVSNSFYSESEIGHIPRSQSRFLPSTFISTWAKAGKNEMHGCYKFATIYSLDQAPFFSAPLTDFVWSFDIADAQWMLVHWFKPDSMPKTKRQGRSKLCLSLGQIILWKEAIPPFAISIGCGQSEEQGWIINNWLFISEPYSKDNLIQYNSVNIYWTSTLCKAQCPVLERMDGLIQEYNG